MALSELYDGAISRACVSLRTAIPCQDALTWLQLKVCLLGRILETDSIYTDVCMMIIYFCLKRSQMSSSILSKC